MSDVANFLNHPIATIEKALHLRKQIEALKASVAEILGGHETSGGEVAKRRGRPPKTASVGSPVVKVDGRKGKRSAASRAKMAAAAKARWAAKKGGEASAPAAAAAPTVTGGKKKRTMSPDARAKIAAAQRARWAQRNQPF